MADSDIDRAISSMRAMGWNHLAKAVEDLEAERDDLQEQVEAFQRA